MYPRERDTRFSGTDSALEIQAKRSIIAALDELRAGPPDNATHDLWSAIAQAESVICAERGRKVKEYEERGE